MPPSPDESSVHEDLKIVFGKAQVLLAEKRTSLATLRTGIAVLALPVSAISFLIVMSNHFHLSSVDHLLNPLLAICGGLLVLGVFLMYRAVRTLLRVDRRLKDLEHKEKSLSQLLE